MSRPRVFISYSHQDEEWKDRLVKQLGVLVREGELEVWDDRKIAAGDAWRAEIDQALVSADAAILLITADFLISEFIRDEEVPRLLERRASEGVLVIPVIVSPCAWKRVGWLAAMQCRPRTGRPVWEGSPVEQEKDLAAIANEIGDLLAQPETEDASAGARSKPELTTVARVEIDRLPTSGRHFVAREKELGELDRAWNESNVHAISIVAWGGVGKSALVDRWLSRMAADHWRGARRVYGWSFYSQGTKERLTAADQFIDDALRWFGDEDPKKGSARDRGLRLADLVRREKTLLILDGVEPLQHPPGPQGGRLKDPALTALVKSLARTNNGLLVLSTREAIQDIANLEDTLAPRLDLDLLAVEDGAALLDVLGVHGTAKERESVAADYKGHALALSLLGTYLAKAHDGEIRKLPEVKIDVADEVAQGGHAWRVIAAYEKWLGEREVSVLRLLGLFDRPAEAEALAALRAAPAVPHLNDGVVELDDADWNVALANLREAGLVLREEGGGAIDAHPLVRAYFGHRLEREHTAAWREGHGRLFEHYRRAAPELPDTLEEMMPLFAAVVHGCRAGMAKQAFDEVYLPRIRRGNEVYQIRNLGALGADLVAVTAFFERPWSGIDPSLTGEAEAWLLNQAGYALQAVGRLAEAVNPLEAALAAVRAVGNWKNTAICASNLSRLALTLGQIDQALERASEAVELADRGGDIFWRVASRASRGDAMHQAGRLDEAVEAFREAEAMQAERERSYPLLSSLQGYQYCDLMLARAGPRAWSRILTGRDAEDVQRLGGVVDEVRRRSHQALEIAKRNRWLRDIALDHLSLGRACFGLLLTETGPKAAEAVDEAAHYLQQAVEGLRNAGTEDHLSPGLLARAAFRRVYRDRASAEADLDEAEEIAERGQMRLFLADTVLERTHLHLAYDEPEAARACLDKARELVEGCGYGRRRPDVAFLEEMLAAR